MVNLKEMKGMPRIFSNPHPSQLIARTSIEPTPEARSKSAERDRPRKKQNVRSCKISKDTVGKQLPNRLVNWAKHLGVPPEKRVLLSRVCVPEVMRLRVEWTPQLRRPSPCQFGSFARRGCV
ncbi:hypothetical protein GW17_00054041 [Ensete ventricosum]|nr:hypothetical protein GW17_00054041 [Ensete ventricosum]